MAPARLAGLDLAIGISVLLAAAVEIAGSALNWTPALGSYTHYLLDDIFLAAFLFFSGLRTTFICSNVLSDGPKQFNYLTSRSIGIFILGALFYLLIDSIFLIHLAVLVFASITLTQLNSTILYFLGITAVLLALVLPLTVSSSPFEARLASSWWSDLLYLRNDSFVPMCMYFFGGMIYGRSDFINPQWQRFIRTIALLVLGGTIFTHFASLDYFKSSYFIEDRDTSRLIGHSIWAYRPIYILASLPLIILLIQLCSYLASRFQNVRFIQVMNRIGQNHLSTIALGLLVAFVVQFIGIENLDTSRLSAWMFILFSLLLFYIFRKQLKVGPVEWIIQRFY